jgi:hypothetical protein
MAEGPHSVPQQGAEHLVVAAVMMLCILDFATPSPFLYFQF